MVVLGGAHHNCLVGGGGREGFSTLVRHACSIARSLVDLVKLPKGAWKLNFNSLPFWKTLTDRPIDADLPNQQTYQQTDIRIHREVTMLISYMFTRFNLQ